MSITSSRSIIDCSSRVCNTAIRCSIDCCAISHCATSCCDVSCSTATCCGIDCCATSRCAINLCRIRMIRSEQSRDSLRDKVGKAVDPERPPKSVVVIGTYFWFRTALRNYNDDDKVARMRTIYILPEYSIAKSTHLYFLTGTLPHIAVIS